MARKNPRKRLWKNTLPQLQAKRRLGITPFKPWPSRWYKAVHHIPTTVGRHINDVPETLKMYHAIRERLLSLRLAGVSVRCIQPIRPVLWPMELNYSGVVCVGGMRSTERRRSATPWPERALVLSLMCTHARTYASDGQYVPAATVTAIASTHHSRYRLLLADLPCPGEDWRVCSRGWMLQLALRPKAEDTYSTLVDFAAEWVMDVRIPGPMH